MRNKKAKEARKLKQMYENLSDDYKRLIGNKDRIDRMLEHTKQELKEVKEVLD